MATIRFITVGTLKEDYLRAAVAEYEKRLSGFCRVESVNLKEAKLAQDPSEAEIKKALCEEAKTILAALPDRAYKIAMCVEGKQFSSEELAAKLENAFSLANEICFIIGSSHGLDDSVKSAADLKLSISKLTFPHQLMRVILSESVYRCMNIIKGTKYHK
ncbi:MAG: 23S rRNA (pseudouridine(1915)-N(3))-methyltransferase RlmH [Ruminococcaceae bacterium]|nr:23S rRNA (pseudouridine(1915)-N(3))-methyltransferase RlmH [Oscillospiraceae bacterium]